MTDIIKWEIRSLPYDPWDIGQAFGEAYTEEAAQLMLEHLSYMLNRDDLFICRYK
jgi:hypothetical protein